MADSPLGPFKKEMEILKSDNVIANSPGHNSYFYLPERDEYIMVYHRRPMQNKTRDGRVLCLDAMVFRGDEIVPVEMT